MDLSTRDCPFTAVDTAQFRMMSLRQSVLSVDVRRTPSTDLLIASFAVVNQPTVHFVSHSFPALRSDPTHSAFVARHLVGICQTAVLREPSRSSGHEFVQRCVLLTFSCCQSQSMFLTSRQPQSMFLTSRQSQSMFVTSCQPQSMFVTVAAGPLTQVSRAMSNASFERPPTMRHPALLIHSCISF